MRGGRGPKRGPCAVVGCKDPESPSGQWNWLPPEEDLAGLEVELQPDAVCFCQKVDCRAAMGKGTRKRKLKEHMAGLGANDPCVPSQYQVKEITEIWGVRYAPNAAEPPSRPYSPCAPCACGRHANLTKMGPRARGETIGKVRSEYMVFGDFVSHSPYVYATTAYWVPLSKLIKDVTRAKAVVEIEIFEGNLAELREDEMARLPSEDEEESD